MKSIIIFEIEGITKSEILDGLGFTIDGGYVITDGNRVLIDDVEMVVSKNGKLTLLTDPLEVSDYFSYINEGDEEWYPELKRG